MVEGRGLRVLWEELPPAICFLPGVGDIFYITPECCDGQGYCLLVSTKASLSICAAKSTCFSVAIRGGVTLITFP